MLVFDSPNQPGMTNCLTLSYLNNSTSYGVGRGLVAKLRPKAPGPICLKSPSAQSPLFTENDLSERKENLKNPTR